MSRKCSIADRRDVGAAMDIYRGLYRDGFAPGEALLNYPGPRLSDEEELRRPAPSIDMSFVNPGDVIIHCTRPPLNDPDENTRKQVHRTSSDLENGVMGAGIPYFKHCSRRCLTMTAQLAALLPENAANRSGVEFYQRACAPYKRFKKNARQWGRVLGLENPRTLACLLVLDEIRPGGPGLVSAWGMDSIATAAWAYRLGTDYAHLLTGRAW